MNGPGPAREAWQRDEAAAEGLALVRHSPFLRRQLSDVTAFADLDLIDRLAAMCRLMANELDHHRLATAAKDRLRALALDSSRVELNDSLDSMVILAQTRSMIVDLLELTGVDYLEARELIPDLSE